MQHIKKHFIANVYILDNIMNENIQHKKNSRIIFILGAWTRTGFTNKLNNTASIQHTTTAYKYHRGWYSHSLVCQQQVTDEV